MGVYRPCRLRASSSVKGADLGVASWEQIRDHHDLRPWWAHRSVTSGAQSSTGIIPGRGREQEAGPPETISTCTSRLKLSEQCLGRCDHSTVWKESAPDPCYPLVHNCKRIVGQTKFCIFQGGVSQPDR